MAENSFYLEIESDPNNLITVEEFVNYFAVELGIKAEKLPGLLLSVTEATTNAIIHANKGNKDKKVKINVNVVDKKVIICIKDEGPWF